MEFCPTCANLLQYEMRIPARLFCRNCPYVCPIPEKVKIKRGVQLAKKKAAPIAVGEKNVGPTTDGAIIGWKYGIVMSKCNIVPPGFTIPLGLTQAVPDQGTQHKFFLQLLHRINYETLIPKSGVLKFYKILDDETYAQCIWGLARLTFNLIVKEENGRLYMDNYSVGS
ncbi:hypothetical protein Cgig2_013076 [Carnegiea gigantea]|uniref:DNA-directed RNA polymerase II subunit RPB9-like zinc ribbon domain-containing protein n=1 Tax=Carnegiea gigantea TaxID=171969 RepID=A0A9Q1QMJ1_9CARY|nr:hypothetical protein Cgig2_013076 [Carnegiea gigantea]